MAFFLSKIFDICVLVKIFYLGLLNKCYSNIAIFLQICYHVIKVGYKAYKKFIVYIKGKAI